MKKNATILVDRGREYAEVISLSSFNEGFFIDKKIIYGRGTCLLKQKVLAPGSGPGSLRNQDCTCLRRKMSMITACSWIPRGAAAQYPSRYNLDDTELSRISNLAKLQLDDAREDLRNARNGRTTESSDDNNDNASILEEDDIAPPDPQM